MKNTMSRLGLLSASIAFGLTMTACSVPAVVVAPSPTASADANPTSPIVVEGEPTEPVDTPSVASLGDTVQLSDWEITVTKVTKNASRAIQKANMFNDKAEGQYMLVEYTAKYTGDERKGDVETDLTWSFTDASGTVADSASVVTPAEDGDAPTSARKGGVVKLDVAFDVDKGKIAGGILSVEDVEIYADWKV